MTLEDAPERLRPLLAALEALGVALSAKDGTLLATPGSRLTPGLRERIGKAKPALLGYFRYWLCSVPGCGADVWQYRVLGADLEGVCERHAGDYVTVTVKEAGNGI